jgi:tetratricopeptide (TPR) repeat protein
MRYVISALFTILYLAGIPRLAAAGNDAAKPGIDGRALLEKGRAQLDQGQVDQAIQTLTLAREVIPNDPAVYNALAKAYVKMGAEPMAVMQLQKSLVVDSLQVDPRLMLAEIHSRNRRWQEAGRLYQEILRRDPENDTAALLLGHLYSMAKQPAAAARALAGYVARHPGDESAAQQYLDALNASGQDPTLATASEAILASRPDWLPALTAAARSNARLGKSEKALEHYARLDAVERLGADDAFTVGRCHLALDHQEEAAQWFERAMSGDLDRRTDWSEAAAAFMRLKRWPEAAKLYERQLAQDSKSVSAWINFGLCNQQMKEYETARRALLQATELRSDNVKSQYALATNYVLMDSTRAARRRYETVVRLASAANDGEYREELRQSYRWLSVSHLVDKNWGPALDALDHALRYDSKDVELRLYRAQVLFALNRKPEARQEFQTVLQMQPGNKEAQKGLNLVAQYN